MDQIEHSTATFQEGYNCAQAVLSSFTQAFGLEREMALRLAGAFGGGMARMGETCGAVTGAFMVIGLKYGMVDSQKKADREKTYETVQEYVRRFKAQHGSILCKELLGADISTAEGRKMIQEQKLNQVCPLLVGDSARILQDLLFEG